MRRSTWFPGSHTALLDNAGVLARIAGIPVGPDEVRKEIDGLLCWVDSASLVWEPVGGTPNPRSNAPASTGASPQLAGPLPTLRICPGALV